MEFSHYSVMLPQCMEGLHIKPDGTYIDGTAGGAGHSKAIAERLTLSLIHISEPTRRS